MTGHTPRRLAAGIAVAGVTAIGGLTLAAIDPIGVVGAQEATTTTVAEGAAGQQAHERGGHERVRRLLRGGLRIAAETLGMTPAELRAELRDDRTVAEVAEERDVPLGDVVDALVAAATERIDAAVADGSLDEERAARLTDGLEERIEVGLSTPRSERPRRDRAAVGD